MGGGCRKACGGEVDDKTLVSDAPKIRIGNSEKERKCLAKIQAHFKRCFIIKILLKNMEKMKTELKNHYKNKIVTYDELLGHEHPNVIQIEQSLPPLKQEDKDVFKYCFEISDKPIITSEDGAPVTIYKGSFNTSGQYHGNGVLVKADGSKYEGYWVSGLLNRNGRFILTNGDYFEGKFKLGEPHGLGIFVQTDGTRYEGNWENSFQHGYGEEYFPDGASYKGDYMYGKKTGLGRFDWEDGSYYDGEISDGKMHGKGMYQYSDGRIYNGDWFENKIHGQGIMTYPDGKKYEGEFREDERSGQGKFTWNRKKWYEGEWYKGKQHGLGTLFYDGRQIKGNWKNGQVSKIQHPKNIDNK